MSLLSLNPLLQRLATSPTLTAIARPIARPIIRAVSYVRAKWRRYRTPKQLRDADFVTWQENMSKCAGCFFLSPDDPIRPTCDICGCLVEFKTRWMSEKCPADEWDNTIVLRQRIAELGKTTSPVNPNVPINPSKEIDHVQDRPAH